jgi:tight adherence protein B
MKLPDLDPVTLVTAVSAFFLVIALWMAALVVLAQLRSRRQRRLRARLDSGSDAGLEARTLRLWHEGGMVTTSIDVQRRRQSIVQRLEEMRLLAGWTTPARSLLATLFACTALAGLGTWLATGKTPLACLVGGTVVLVFWWRLGASIQRRSAIFERQLVDGLDLSCRALRAGHPLLGSFQLIADEVPAPVGRIFAGICQEHALGVALEESLRRAAEESHSPDMKLFAASMAINMRTGGNLADVIKELAGVIRDRMRLNRRFRVLTSQTQFSKKILIGMPFVMFGVLNLLNPEYAEPLYATSTGNKLLLLAAFGIGLGWWTMNRMSRLEA